MASRQDCIEWDNTDALAAYRGRFILPEGSIYCDGNSLGLMPRSVPASVAFHMDVAWGVDLIASWNRHGWFELPLKLGNKISPLVGGGLGNVVVADTISVNLFKVLSAALRLRPGRHVVLSDNGNFPSDLYVAQGLLELLGDTHTLTLVAPEDVEQSITDDVAIVMLTDVDYRTSRRHNMAAITAKAHANGCLIIWDLSHSTGAMQVDLLGCGADFAVGCTYKYLNGGPGAPAFVFVHPRHQSAAMPGLQGWWGHVKPFDFDPHWRAADGVARFQCGTQAVLSMAALDAALDLWSDVDMELVRTKSQSLCGLFVAQVETFSESYGLRLAGPRDIAQRGSHVSFHCPNGYAVMQAMIDHGVIGDFRAPDLIRFGFAPLYNTHVEVFDAAQQLFEIFEQGLWRNDKYQTRRAVT
jgi:kynureninase